MSKIFTIICHVTLFSFKEFFKACELYEYIRTVQHSPPCLWFYSLTQSTLIHTHTCTHAQPLHCAVLISTYSFDQDGPYFMKYALVLVIFPCSKACAVTGWWGLSYRRLSSRNIQLNIPWIPWLHLHLHFVDAFFQSDLQGCIYILHLHWWHTAHQEQLGVQCLAQRRFDSEESN